jgi:type I restriction enzyme S subunit
MSTADVDKLPEGWAELPLESLADDPSTITYGVLKPGPVCAGGVAMLRVKDIVGNQLDDRELYRITPQLDSEYRRTKLKGGEVVVTVQGSVGRVAIVPSHVAGANISRTIAVIRPVNPELGKWIWLGLQSPGVQKQIGEAIGGTTRDSLNIRDLRLLPIPLPPLEEQRRIVAAVERLLGRVSAARDRLNRVPATLKRFRQAVLAAACSGRLTTDWRENNSDLKPASELLARIQAERQAASIKQGHKPKDEEEALDVGRTEPSDLPGVWEWVQVSHLLHYARAAGYGVLQPGPELPEGAPMVRVCDIENGTVLVQQLKRIAPDIDHQYRRTRLQGGEVLVTLVGTIGRTAVAPLEATGANIARAVAMLPLCPHVVPEYLQFALSEPTKNQELVDLAREVARKTLNLGLLKTVRVPLPPFPEQREIVRRVGELFAMADAVEVKLAAARRRADSLAQAVLAKAFRGELVLTEAELARRQGREYEPASTLLERIQEEREKVKSTEKKQTGSKKQRTFQRKAHS